jgi:hypothetical protein
MAFKINDLMVNIVPGEGDQQLCVAFTRCIAGTGWCGPILSRWCPPFTIDCYRFTIGGCGYFLSCPAHSLVCVPGTVCAGGSGCGVGSPIDIGPGPVIQPGDLAALKEELRQMLNAVEQQEQAMAERMRPQSVEQIDTLQEKLKGAIAELDRQKADLQKRGTKG